eukprot:PhF_6_TR39681/c0_g1_i5/m.58954
MVLQYLANAVSLLVPKVMGTLKSYCEILNTQVKCTLPPAYLEDGYDEIRYIFDKLHCPGSSAGLAAWSLWLVLRQGTLRRWVTQKMRPNEEKGQHEKEMILRVLCSTLISSKHVSIWTLELLSPFH